MSDHICTVCGVTIDENDRVLFSYGKPGTRERLYARVCRYAQNKAGCINQSEEVAKNIKPGDGYAEFE